MTTETQGQETPAVTGEAQPLQTAQTDNGEAVTTTAQTDGDEGGKESPEQEERKFTQKELDDILQKRLAKERRQFQSIERKAIQMAREMTQPRQEQPQAPADDGKPRREMFASEDDWLDARDNWRDQQRERQTQTERARTEAQRLAEKTDKLYAEAEKLPGFDRDAFDDVLGTPGLSRDSLRALIESDQAPQLMAHFASNPEDVERIAGLTPARQAAELGKLEAKLQSAPKTTKAPAPINGSVKGAGKGTPDLDSADFATYKKMRAEMGARWAR